MANGNNGNASDTTTATPQQQQEQRLPQSAQQSNLTAATESLKEPASITLGVNDLVADLCLNDRSSGDFTSMRTSTSGAGTGAASTSSFSFKHFLSNTGTVTAPSSTVTSVDASAAVQTSTGARPKVPQSASASHMQPPDVNGSNSSSKMKRSPRFSSFDSQASLAEFAACGGGSQHRLRPDQRLGVGHGVLHAALDNDDDDDHVTLAQVRNSRLYDERIDDDIFPSAASNLQPAAGTRYVPRSYSSYEMPQVSCPTSSPRRRPSGNRDQRPNRLVLSSGSKMKLDLPLDAANATGVGASGGAGTAATLPDFVQDHLPDAWCVGQDAQLSSPPNTPLGAAQAPSAAACLLPSALASMGLPSAVALPGPLGEPPTGPTVKVLPDFLSDGSIIHSSQRLADVAIGLPSNAIDSPPQDVGGTLCALRQENDRLQRELQDARIELNAQARRASEFEQQLVQLQEATERREALALATNTQTTQRLRLQIAQLEAELITLRSGGSFDGAAGGVPSANSGSAANSGTSSARSSRAHQLSRDLLRAADTAEQNLRQLLTGVENLRQMAANLEHPIQPTTAPRSPDLYSDSN
ncbi:uncharacterized protein LOC110190242 [Drosophila serrata]|uniref:uncharacterized protein LOC110190242 n=1 Tax=Drosophila serrata TaxID=7274 RepID=UPI000A1D1952|nr:uncharacterized protein LOC110190242 [Drosophila serrata]KAH8360653.1 hypothetical protein KR200_011179 [Drosophila serrata]